jgi:hypothetical protein
MAAITGSAEAPKRTPSFSLAALVAFLFQLQLREKLDAATGGDKSDGAYTWGM